MRAHDPLADPRPLIESVYAYVAYRIGPGPDAEDVTSDVFERALRYRSSYDRSRAEPLPWLIGIARRSIADHFARPRLVVDPDRAGQEEVGDSAAFDDSVADRLSLIPALRSLNAHDRELIALRYGADMTSRQIASLLDARPNTVEVGLHRALGRLRRELEAASSAAAPEPARPSRALDRAASEP